MAEPVEKWGPGRKSLTYVVALEGAEVQKTFSSWDGQSVRRYVVDRVEVTTRWELGREEEGRTAVKLDCREIIGGQATLRVMVFYPEDLDEVPPWLVELETRASPRDVGDPMKVEPRFRAGPFQVSGGGCMTALIVLGLLVLCCPWSSVVMAIWGK